MALEKANQVGRQAQQHEYAADNHGYTNDLIDNADARRVELRADAVHQPSQSPPPQQGTAHDAGKAHKHLERMVRQHEGELGVEGEEQEDNQRVGECHEERRPGIIPQRSLLLSRLMHLLRGITLIRVQAEAQQHDTTAHLQVESVLVVVDQVHHERHTEACEARIQDIADSSTRCTQRMPTGPIGALAIIPIIIPLKMKSNILIGMCNGISSAKVQNYIETSDSFWINLSFYKEIYDLTMGAAMSTID